eukprot:TRINITY_DN2554_c2_g1_i1.p1 TRINITY_DN2554_c2_g1~~TRINITY_DN2554_c2_g1_i1.p1  ORF type:complete len:199 (+),score=55.46 TRINITY_DN2554_c2_g1_i1:25-597(+)
MLRKALPLGCTILGGAGGYWYLSERDTGCWVSYDLERIGVRGYKEKKGVIAVCKDDPYGLSCALWGDAMGDGKWKWSLEKQGEAVEVGLCKSEDFKPAYTFKAIKQEVPSWRGVSDKHANHAGTHTTHNISIPNTATCHMCYDASTTQFTFCVDGQRPITMGAPPPPVHAVARFSRTGHVEMLSPPTKIE